MMKWLKKKSKRQGPDALAQLLRRGMEGGPVVTAPVATPTLPTHSFEVPGLTVPTVIDSIPVFIPPQGARR